MSANKKPRIDVTQPTTPCYCTVCDAPNAIKIRLDNPKVGTPATFALCEEHADSLAFRLTNLVRRRRVLRAKSPTPSTEPRL